MLVGAEIVDPEVLGPGLFAGFLAIEEEDVGFDALGVENAGGEAQEGVDVAALEQFAADGFAGSAFEEDVVGEDDGGGATDFDFADDGLEEVELFVRGGELLDVVAIRQAVIPKDAAVIP